MGTQPPPKKEVEPGGGGGWSPPMSILAHVYFGQTAGCIKMPLGMEVGLSPSDFVLDGDPAPYPKRVESPNFRPRLLWPNGCMDQDGTWYGGRPRPRPTRHCGRWGPSCLSPNGDSPQFRSMSIVEKRLDGLRYHLVWR